MSDLGLGVSGISCLDSVVTRNAMIAYCYPTAYSMVGIINYAIRLSRTWETVI